MSSIRRFHCSTTHNYAKLAIFSNDHQFSKERSLLAQVLIHIGSDMQACRECLLLLALSTCTVDPNQTHYNAGDIVINEICPLQELMIMNNNIMEEINKMEETKHQAEQRWIGRWRNSVDNVKQLYAL